MNENKIYAIILAILAAVFYAVGTPLSKVLMRYSEPTMLAAFLYLGAGIGIAILYFCRKDREEQTERLSKADLPYTIGMIILDIAAPIFLMNGVERTAAANASLLGNFEIVATALIAFGIFHEKISGIMWIALSMVIASSFILSFEGSSSLHFSAGSLMVIGAAACWGLENNCTRMISNKSTYEIVILKGFFSGSASFIIALVIGENVPSVKIMAATLLLGFVAYGLSIFTYIRAQSAIGAAKTSAFYALAPFISAIISFLILREPLSGMYVAGFLIMIPGSMLAVIDTLKYRHSHIHRHTVYHIVNGHLKKEVIIHEHEHTHIGPGLAHHH